jgi:hypothetical protein
MRIVLNYYRVLLSANLPFSFVFGFLYGITAFLISFCTFGLLLSAFFFELYYRQRYYFYFNKGFSRSKLISYCFLINLGLVTLFVLLKYMFNL